MTFKIRSRQSAYIRLAFTLLTWTWMLAPATASVVGSAQHKVALGEEIFNDHTLADPGEQSCATCHQDWVAFTDGLESSFGANQAQGTRNASTLLYLKFSPPFSYDKNQQTWVGGQFWDGRADTFQEQAKGPFFNPIEMNNTPEGLDKRLRKAHYYKQFAQLYGKENVTTQQGLLNAALDALAHFQSSQIFEPFTAKYDYVVAGKAVFTAEEALGKRLFEGKAHCVNCHHGVFEGKQIFTAFYHHNILTPKNTNLPIYLQDKQFIDEGTAQNPAVSQQESSKARGRFKTPTLRNIAKTAPYMHNGVFTDLKQTIEYHLSTKDRKRWGPAEVSDNASPLLPASILLNAQELEALVAFLNTLTDEYELPSADYSPAKIK